MTLLLAIGLVLGFCAWLWLASALGPVGWGLSLVLIVWLLLKGLDW